MATKRKAKSAEQPDRRTGRADDRPDPDPAVADPLAEDMATGPAAGDPAQAPPADSTAERRTPDEAASRGAEASAEDDLAAGCEILRNVISEVKDAD